MCHKYQTLSIVSVSANVQFQQLNMFISYYNLVSAPIQAIGLSNFFVRSVFRRFVESLKPVGRLETSLKQLLIDLAEAEVGIHGQGAGAFDSKEKPVFSGM